MGELSTKNDCTSNVALAYQSSAMKFGGAVALDMGTLHEAVYKAFYL